MALLFLALIHVYFILWWCELVLKLPYCLLTTFPLWCYTLEISIWILLLFSLNIIILVLVGFVFISIFNVRNMLLSLTIIQCGVTSFIRKAILFWYLQLPFLVCYSHLVLKSILKIRSLSYLPDTSFLILEKYEFIRIRG